VVVRDLQERRDQEVQQEARVSREPPVYPEDLSSLGSREQLDYGEFVAILVLQVLFVPVM